MIARHNQHPSESKEATMPERLAGETATLKPSLGHLSSAVHIAMMIAEPG